MIRTVENQSPPDDALSDQLANVSTGPGVYIMKDTQRRIIYVGKARNLKKRLQSYFQKGRPHDPKTMMLLSKIVSFEVIITHTEKEALILESNLIKRHRPRYNVVLKDDKRYPALRLDLSEPYPDLVIVRKIQNDGALYFGPYASAGAVRQTLKFIQKTFKLRKCRNKTFSNRTRPCINYQMGLCLGPCCTDVDPGVYGEIVKEVIAFLRGRTPALIRKINREMLAAAHLKDFEKAAELRDKLFALQKTLERQVSVSTDFKDRDVIGMTGQNGILVTTLLRVRGGFLLGSRHFFFTGTVGSFPEQMAVFLHQYYAYQQNIPAEIITSHAPEDQGLIKEHLSDKRGRKVHILVPTRGEKSLLVRMAIQNARSELQERIRQGQGQTLQLERLQKKLHLKLMPRRIECFDNSNLSGTEPVSGMVVFQDGQAQTKEYRRYKLKRLEKPDDYAYMAEVLQRRLGKGEASRPFPDLLMVDGGRGQLGIAMEVLTRLQLTNSFDVLGIAKHDKQRGESQDKIYLPGRANAVQFGRDSDLLVFLQRIRDEAHRWAIRFQRQIRQKKAMRSVLEDIPGVGPKKRAILLKHFGGIDNIRRASAEQLQVLPGITEQLARQILSFLESRQL